MDAIITGSVALCQMRRLRTSRELGGAPTSLRAVPQCHGHAELGARLDAPALRELLQVSDNDPLPVRAPHASKRGHCMRAPAHVLASTFPAGAVWELRGQRMCDTWGNGHLYVDGPELCMLSAANELLSRIRCGNLTRKVAIPKLADLIMEMCGTYVRNPLSPRTGGCTFGVRAAMSVAGLGEFVRQMSKAKGAKLVGEALRWSQDGSRSPMETFLWLAFGCPPRLGGVSVGTMLLNEPLRLSARQLDLINHHRITPDLQILAFKALVEYLGEGPHEGRRAHNEDRRRWQDYTTLRARSYPMTFGDVRTPAAFNAFCRRLAEGMDDPERRLRLHHVNRLFRDESFLAAQRRLFAALLPPVTRYDRYLGVGDMGRDALWGF